MALSTPAPLPNSRRGVSLIELLVVIVIMLIITAAAIPTFRPALESRRLREGARLVSSYFEQAKNKARGSGRPVGVRIDALDAEPGAAMVLSLVETPAPWAGDSVSSRVTFGSNSNPDFGSDNPAAIRQIKKGDFIKLNYRGHMWQILTFDGADDISTRPNWEFRRSDEAVRYVNQKPHANGSTPRVGNQNPTSQSPLAPPAIGTPGVPFQVFKQPIKSAVTPLQLPDGIVVDMYSSGMGNDSGALGSITVVFSPSGHVDAVWSAGGTPLRPTAPLHFLLGKREKATTRLEPATAMQPARRVPLLPYVTSDPPAVQQRKHNWRDLENIWVSINPQTGLVSSTNVAFFNDQDSSYSPMNESKARGLSRRSAVDFQSMGGK